MWSGAQITIVRRHGRWLLKGGASGSRGVNGNKILKKGTTKFEIAKFDGDNLAIWKEKIPYWRRILVHFKR